MYVIDHNQVATTHKAQQSIHYCSKGIRNNYSSIYHTQTIFLHILYTQRNAIAEHEIQGLMDFAFMLFVLVFLVSVFVFTLIFLLVVMLVSAASPHWLVVIWRHMAVTTFCERGQHRL